ncbi:MepB family protein [Paenibacillus sp. FSL F4-0087]|uniref:MepB family protein n=1 Tax=Paenibacillus sp. FSL F4-0087 TaxID=2921368 RepID=UPI00096E2616|nr:MepB protein [Paenibacillus pabuli]
MFKSKELIDSLLANFDNIEITNIIEEKHNREYEGMIIYIGNYTYRSRLAKLTPKKKGFFVVFWEKDENNQNQPYSFFESPDKLIISIMNGNMKGQFVFPKSKLLEKGILKNEDTKGKMAIRVYPSWEKELNKSAAQTQKWQQEYFIDLSDGIDDQKLIDLYFGQI